MIGGIEEAMNISTHSLTRRLTVTLFITEEQYDISTHSLTRRLTAILFNKNRFVQFIFIALYQSPPTTSPPSSFFSPYFLIFSKNIRCESPEDW